MRIRSTVSAILATLGATLLCALPAGAQTGAKPPPNPMISIDYIEPRSPEFLPYMESLQKVYFLENLASFLSPLRLKHKLRLVTKECGAVNSQYKPDYWQLEICYDYLRFLDKSAPPVGTTTGPLQMTYYDVVWGGMLDVTFHELGHAIFDNLSVPIYGSEEDAADQISAYVLLSFGPQLARQAARGAAYGNIIFSPDPRASSAFADVHGTASQRYYNYLCIAYGSDPQNFKDFIDNGLLPPARAQNCAHEFQQAQRAFAKTILPYVDQNLLQQVRAVEWIIYK